MSIIITFIRHGEMPINREENYTWLIKDGLNGPLTERGIAEAMILGKYLSDEKFTKAFASEFIRTQQTAEHVLSQCKHTIPEVVIDKRISERNAGDWVEKTPLDMIAEAVRTGMYPHFLPCPGGETVEEVMTRAGEFFAEQCKLADNNGANENILVATHGAWLAHLMEVLIQNPALYTLEDCDVKLARKPAPTTGVTKIEIFKRAEDKRPRVLKFHSLHDQTHLKDQVMPN